ncbi:MAG: tetratricopeptide repeat-containing serine protease family protein, partial [Cyanobacteria bacterium P01_A01_bin.83]
MLTKIPIALSLIISLGTIGVTYRHQSHQQINSAKIIAQQSTADIAKIARDITVQVYAGSDRGSGILIANNSSTYTVLTNAHVTDRGDIYIIQTSDGVKHEARIVTKDGQDRGNDLAILEFNSSNTYQVGKLGNSDDVGEGETVIAAGFPDEKQQLLVTEGKISLLPKKPLKKGYSIGFSNQTSQGMSGGVLLNSSGEAIAVLGKGQDAILDTAYDYIDDTQPTAAEIAAFREVGFAIPIANIQKLSPQLASLLPGENNADLVQQPTTTETPTEKTNYRGVVGKVDQIARQITVRIDTPIRDKDGSGVIIAHQDNTYYVATAGHVVDKDGEYKIVTPDGETYQLDNQTIIESDAYDFALFSFTSDRDYTVATLGNYNLAVNERQVVFVSGFPHHQSPQRIITGGKAIEKNQTNFKTRDSYSLIDAGQGLLYTNISYSGMSGGVVLDIEGRLVGINTGAENDIYDDDSAATSEQLSLGYSFGIPIQDIVGFLSTKTQFDTKLLQQNSNPAAPISDRDYSSLENQLFTAKKPDNESDLVAWINYGNLLWRYEKPNQAIAAFEKAIEIDPQFDQAYYAMSLAYLSQEKYPKAVTTLNKATHLNPNPYFYWRYLGWYYSRLNQFENAFLAYEEAISKNAEDFVLYQEYGDVLDDAGQHNKAISSYNEALKLNPNHPWIYNNRGNAYYHDSQYESALA